MGSFSSGHVYPSGAFQGIEDQMIKEYALECFHFLKECELLMDDNKKHIDTRILHICDEYMKDDSPQMINVSADERHKVLAKCKQLKTLKLKEKRALFDKCIVKCQSHMSDISGRLLCDPKFEKHVRKWKENQRKTENFQHKILDHKNANRRGTVCVKRGDEEKEMKPSPIMVNSKGYESPSASPHAHSPLSSLLSTPCKNDGSIQSIMEDKLRMRIKKDDATLLLSAERARCVSGIERSRRAPKKMASRMPQSGKTTKAKAGQSLTVPSKKPWGKSRK